MRSSTSQVWATPATVVDLEKDKPTVQLQKVLDLLDLEVLVRAKAARSL